MLKHLYTFLFLSIFLLFVSPTTSMAQSIPQELSTACNLPEDFSFEDSSGMPANYAAFNGILKGKWDSKLDSYLVVTSIDEDGEFDGYYYWGVYEPWDIEQAGCESISGKIKKKVLKFKTSASQRYKLKKNYVSATFTRNGRTTNGKFHKLENF